MREICLAWGKKGPERPDSLWLTDMCRAMRSEIGPSAPCRCAACSRIACPTLRLKRSVSIKPRLIAVTLALPDPGIGRRLREIKQGDIDGATDGEFR